MGKRIALIFEEDYLGSYPSFIESISLLSKQGHKVDVIGTTRVTQFPSPPQFPQNVKFYNLSLSSKIDRNYSNEQSAGNFDDTPIQSKKISLFKYFLPSKLKQRLRGILNFLKFNFSQYQFQKRLIIDNLRYTTFVLSRLARKKYEVVIGVDLGGGSAAYISSLFLSIDKLVYWGLEITTPYQPLVYMRILKFFEERMCYNSDLMLTTDMARAKDVCNENKTPINKKNVICLPHSPSGFCESKHSDFFQKLFSLDNEIVTILHSGWIHEVMKSTDLARIATQWPNDWKLIFHERMKRKITEPYIKQVIKAGSNTVLLSLNPVPYDQIDHVVLSSKIGIVIYGNHEEWGTSWISLAKGSGKIAHYLKCGKPVLCINLPGLNEIITKYQCGILFDNLEDIQSGIYKILGNYSFYSQNAYKCYREEYEFSNYFKQFTMYVDS
jgi:glycosyltransferase involved in cell wall biosynthesis